MIYLYNEVYDKNEEIEMRYIPKPDNNDKVRIFGENF